MFMFLAFLGYELNCIFEDMVRVLWHRLEDIISVVLFFCIFIIIFFLNVGLDAMIMLLDDDDND